MSKHLVRGASIALAVLGLVSAPAWAGPGRHPHFDDGGTLPWFTKLSEALACARAEGKVVLVEYGRLRCTQCRVLVSKVIPDGAVRDRVARLAVGLASDCDHPEPGVECLLQKHLADEGLLPLVGFLLPDGRWIDGFGGGRSVAQFQADLDRAERALGAWRAAQGPARPPAPAVAPFPPPSPAPAPSCPRTPAETAPVPPPPEAAAALPAPAVFPAPTAPLASVVRREEAPPDAAELSPEARRALVLEAASLGAWGRAMSLCRGGSPQDPVLSSVRSKARGWAQDHLGHALTASQQRRYQEALFAVSRVRDAMQGEPEAEEASRGLEAIAAAREIARMDPRGAVAASARRSALERSRDTRWEQLFR